MKKLMIAIAAVLGLTAAASAPASAGGSLYVSGSWNVPTYSYTTPHYYNPAPIYRAPVVVPRYYTPAPVISFNFGRTFRSHRDYGHRHNGHDRWDRRIRRIDRQIQRADRRADRRERRRNRDN